MNTVPTEEQHVIVRYDPNLVDVFGHPAECRLSYEHTTGADPVMVITFGPVEPVGDYMPLLHQMRVHAGAPRFTHDDTTGGAS